MQYQEAVTEARTLITRAEEDQWRLAQLTWEQTRQNDVTIRQWASDIGMKSVSYVGSLARLWERHRGDSLRPPFPEAMLAVHRPCEYADAQEFGSRKQAEIRQAVRNLPPERKTEVVREALSDPD